MHAVVHHRVIDRDRFLAADPQDIAGNAPSGVQIKHFLPAGDASVADCLWEGPSLDAIRDYVDEATSGICENSWFEVDSTSAVGLPQSSSASA